MNESYKMSFIYKIKNNVVNNAFILDTNDLRLYVDEYINNELSGLFVKSKLKGSTTVIDGCEYLYVKEYAAILISKIIQIAKERNTKCRDILIMSNTKVLSDILDILPSLLPENVYFNQKIFLDKDEDLDIDYIEFILPVKCL